MVKVVGMWKGMGGGIELLLLAPDEEATEKGEDMMLPGGVGSSEDGI